jgi:predicted amidohydrolase
MFTTGFSMNPAHLAQNMNGSSVTWLREKSRQKNADIVGSIIVADNGKFFNRLIWAKPQGQIYTYDKRHLFRMAGEEKVYSEGHQNITVELQGWKIRPFICYDLRFPVWTRNIGNRYDAAIFIANWPERRSVHWKLLLQARAIENQCYVIGVNRVGIDGNGHTYSGDSSIIDPFGSIIFQKQDKAVTYTADLSHETLQNARESFPVWMDADSVDVVKQNS